MLSSIVLVGEISLCAVFFLFVIEFCLTRFRFLNKEQTGRRYSKNTRRMSHQQQLSSNNSVNAEEINRARERAFIKSLSPDEFALWVDGRSEEMIPPYDKVYSVGCFDLFHAGHRRLLGRLKKIGKNVIVGVHDSSSIEILKKRTPIDSTETRLCNVRECVSQAFTIAGTDPSNFVACAISLDGKESGVYVRGSDMINFPGREKVESYCDVAFLPYTQGVSSTMIRKKLMEEKAKAEALANKQK